MIVCSPLKVSKLISKLFVSICISKSYLRKLKKSLGVIFKYIQITFKVSLSIFLLSFCDKAVKVVLDKPVSKAILEIFIYFCANNTAKLLRIINFSICFCSLNCTISLLIVQLVKQNIYKQGDLNMKTIYPRLWENVV